MYILGMERGGSWRRSIYPPVRDRSAHTRYRDRTCIGTEGHISVIGRTAAAAQERTPPGRDRGAHPRTETAAHRASQLNYCLGSRIDQLSAAGVDFASLIICKQCHFFPAGYIIVVIASLPKFSSCWLSLGHCARRLHPVFPTIADYNTPCRGLFSLRNISPAKNQIIASWRAKLVSNWPHLTSRQTG